MTTAIIPPTAGPRWKSGDWGGPVPLSDVGGRAEFITFSLDNSETWNPLTWWAALRGDRAGRTLRPAIDPHPARP